MLRARRIFKRNKLFKYGSYLPAGVRRSKTTLFFAKLALLGVGALFLGLFVVLPLFALNLPSPDKIVRQEGFSTKILDRTGKPLYDIFADEKRTPISISEVPEHLKHATIAIEDKNFYSHQGFDLFGMLRGFSRIFTRGYAQGGSTLTQQLVKNVILTSERSLIRKIKEFALAVQIERKYTKDEILQMYLNEAPYGGTAWGVEAASETYFGKRVSELTLIESAFLAGLPQRPSYYTPYGANPKAYVGRTEAVLRRMREDGYITTEEEEKAKEVLPDLKIQDRGGTFKAPHFVSYVQSILEERYGEEVIERGGLIVTTTLDYSLQEKAQEIVKEEIEKAKSLKVGNGAAVVINPETGEVLAMVGSKGFSDPDIDGQVNVTLSPRQPGSAIKPITYLTALTAGYTPATLLMDTETEFPGGVGQPNYKPGNYDGKFRGPIQMRYALANSVNVPAVKMLAMVGVKNMLQMAYDLGITSLEPTKETLSRVGLAVTLGGGEVRLLELASAYGVFMNGGFRVDPIAILEVKDASGKVIEKVDPKKGRSVVTPEQAYLIADMLSDNEARSAVFGTNSLLNIPNYQVAVKTGTTNDKRDNWAIGGNKTAVTGVWVGNNDNSPMLSVASGVSGASPIWRKIMLAILASYPSASSFDVPGGIITKSVDSLSGYPAHDGFPERTEKFASGTDPSGDDPFHLKLKICKSEGKLATPPDIAGGNYEDKEFFVFKEEDPLSTDGVNRWQEGIDKWVAAQSDSRYHPPSSYCGVSNPVNVEFLEPTDRTSNLPNNFKVRVKADSTSDISQIELEVDGVKIRTFTNPPFEHDIDLANGVHELRAKGKDINGNESDRRITIGVGVAWDGGSPTPTP